MEWTTIDYGGTEIQATDFLNGVFVDLYPNGSIIFIPGYYVQEQLGDMDGPALRERKTRAEEYEIIMRKMGWKS